MTSATRPTPTTAATIDRRQRHSKRPGRPHKRPYDRLSNANRQRVNAMLRGFWAHVEKARELETHEEKESP
jgi:hypothetical protein